MSEARDWYVKEGIKMFSAVQGNFSTFGLVCFSHAINKCELTNPDTDISGKVPMVSRQSVCILQWC